MVYAAHFLPCSFWGCHTGRHNLDILGRIRKRHQWINSFLLCCVVLCCVVLKNNHEMHFIQPLNYIPNVGLSDQLPVTVEKREEKEERRRFKLKDPDLGLLWWRSG